jgi:hypothetical protein
MLITMMRLIRQSAKTKPLLSLAIGIKISVAAKHNDE